MYESSGFVIFAGEDGTGFGWVFVDVPVLQLFCFDFPSPEVVWLLGSEAHEDPVFDFVSIYGR